MPIRSIIARYTPLVLNPMLLIFAPRIVLEQVLCLIPSPVYSANTCVYVQNQFIPTKPHADALGWVRITSRRFFCSFSFDSPRLESAHWRTREMQIYCPNRTFLGRQRRLQSQRNGPCAAGRTTFKVQATLYVQQSGQQDSTKRREGLQLIDSQLGSVGRDKTVPRGRRKHVYSLMVVCGWVFLCYESGRCLLGWVI